MSHGRHHFVIEKCSHLANGWTTKCGCIGLILCLGTIICDINTIGFVSVKYIHAESVTLWLMLCNRSLGVHGPKWTSHDKWEGDVALID